MPMPKDNQDTNGAIARREPNLPPTHPLQQEYEEVLPSLVQTRIGGKIERSSFTSNCPYGVPVTITAYVESRPIYDDRRVSIYVKASGAGGDGYLLYTARLEKDSFGWVVASAETHYKLVSKIVPHKQPQDFVTWFIDHTDDWRSYADPEPVSVSVLEMAVPA